MKTNFRTARTMLISTEELAIHLHDPRLVVVDLRWESSGPEAGIEAFRQGHIPGAIFLNMDNDLADRSDLSRGRHPLPDPKVFVQMLAGHGIGQGTRLVVYDDKAGSLAARLWWMMRWSGAPETEVLDGGFQKWVAEGREVETGKGKSPLPHPKPIVPNVRRELTVDIEEVATRDRDILLLDARAPERYRGEVEPIDPRAGHIPGAVNAPWEENVTGSFVRTFRDANELRTKFEKLGVKDPSKVVCYCGSGVTACHDLLALEIAGMHGAKLYPGSWSEWSGKMRDEG